MVYVLHITSCVNLTGLCYSPLFNTSCTFAIDYLDILLVYRKSYWINHIRNIFNLNISNRNEFPSVIVNKVEVEKKVNEYPIDVILLHIKHFLCLSTFLRILWPKLDY